MTISDASGRLVLIDDSPVILEVVGKGLEDMGWTVHRALGGAAGRKRIDELDPEVVVCDLHMPEVTGLDVIEHVREEHPTALVIMLSGDAQLDAALAALRHGAFDYVVKADDDLRPLGEAVRRAFEHLLLDILPKRIAERLKAKGEHQILADHFQSVTVMFADIVGFTPLCSQLTPAELVAMLNGLFTRFDLFAQDLGVEKNKTLGDAYMSVTGLPVELADHAEVATLMALRMFEQLEDYNAVHELGLGMRIGLHSGSVVAGVIGRNKFLYDLWGDTVNIASRMESHGQPGSIQVTEATRDLLGDRFLCEPRGTVEVKGKGPMPTWLVKGLA